MESKTGIVMFERGLGLGYDGVAITLYKDYTDYSKYVATLREYPFVELSGVDTFLINMDDSVRYLPLTLKKYANLLLQKEESS